MSITIVADSTCAPSDGLVRSLGIAVIPISIFLDGKMYLDRIDLEPGDLYARLSSLKELPTTAAPPPGRFRDAFEQLLAEAGTVLCFTVTTNLSATYSSALQARQSMPPEARQRIEIVDTQTAGAAASTIVAEAGRLAEAGCSLDEIMSRADSMIPRCKLIGALDTLEYLKRSGRVKKISALAGDFFKIKPVFYLKQGKAEAFARPRGKRQALELMLQAFLDDVAGAKEIRAAVTHAGAPDESSQLALEINRHYPEINVDPVPFTVAMGCHTGPGVVGIGYTSFLFDSQN